MSHLREMLLLDLFTRMADYIDHHGLGHDAALARAFEDMDRELRAALAPQEITRGMREASVPTKH